MFVDIKNVIREEHFDESHKETTCTGKKTLAKQDANNAKILKDERLAKSMAFDYRPSGKSRHLLVFFIY